METLKCLIYLARLTLIESFAFLTDIQPPSIQCPPNIDVPTAAGKSYATVTWQVPVPTDNSNEPLNITGLIPPQQLNVGRTNIKYIAMDSVGLSRSCVFSIHVKGIGFRVYLVSTQNVMNGLSQTVANM